MNSANFNAIAPFYSGLQRLVFGHQLQTAQLHFLKQHSKSKTILIVGGGTGDILPDILKEKPSKITFVEKSEVMLKLAKARSNSPLLEFVYTDFFEYQTTEQYDVILLPFFLDLFTKEESEKALEKCKDLLVKNGLVLVTDFVATTQWNQKILLKLMYWFFGVFSSVKVNQLPTIGFQSHRYCLIDSKSFVKGMVEAQVYSIKYTRK